MDLIDQVRSARRRDDWVAEAVLRKDVRKSARRDKVSWLEGLAAEGSWSSLGRLRRGSRRSQGRLRDAAGDLVSTEARAETFAAHLEAITWRVRRHSSSRCGALS